MPSPEEILAPLPEQRATQSLRYPILRLALFGSWADEIVISTQVLQEFYASITRKFAIWTTMSAYLPGAIDRAIVAGPEGGDT